MQDWSRDQNYSYEGTARMAFKDKLKTLFHRKDQGEETMTTPSLATKEEREELLTQLDGNFSQVGQSLDMLNEHLSATKDFLADIAATHKELPEFLKQHSDISKQLIESSSSTQAAQNQLVTSLTEHLKERDHNQAALTEHLASLAEKVNQQHDHYQSQLNIVMRFHRSGRRMTLSLIIILGALFIGVLALLLAIVLRLPPFDRVMDRNLSVLPPPAATEIQSPISKVTTPPSLSPQPPVEQEVETPSPSAVPAQPALSIQEAAPVPSSSPQPAPVPPSSPQPAPEPQTQPAPMPASAPNTTDPQDEEEDLP